ncbi:hypothetical protein CHS0354_043025 [Potamilus streckersoni]|uniref:Uncharacterized protein n=1 Tax=Potamilus streckersoni TaxID=2493646 RepID=A0AAE0SDY4_9BIVA|nr:hypothetical protein CHS0354_043025 [Potamilus streckersoni]
MSDTHRIPSSFPVNYEASSGFDHSDVLVDQAGEKAPLIPTVVTTKVYFKRWYILVVFSLGASIQGGVWNTWGPIASASEDAFGWTDSTIALLSNWGPIAYIITAFPLSWLIDVKGIRWATLCMSFLVVLGTGLRCITSDPTTATWLIHIGQFINGAAGPVAMGGPPVVSAEWFPPHQRTTATAVSIVISSFGVATSFLLGPYLVPERKNTNQTHSNCSSSPSYFSRESSYLSDDLTGTQDGTRNDIMLYMYIAFGVSVFVFLLILIYFPNKPPLPPSMSASVERLDFSSGFKCLVRNVTFWQISLVYGVSVGVYNCWAGVLDVNLKSHNISETEAGWLGFYGIVAGCFSGLFVARLADIFSRHMKKYLITLFILAGITFAVFTLVLYGAIPFSTGIVYTTLILVGLLLSASTPLFYETCCEATYPVAEGITNFALTLMNNIGGLVFLLIQMIPNIGTMWENWCLLGSIVFCLPVLFFLRDNYNRLEVDERSVRNTADSSTDISS